MNLTNIGSKDVIFSLDIGTRSIKGTVGVVKDRKFYVVAESYEEHNERSMIDGQIHDIELVASTVKHVKNNLEKELGFSLKEVSIAAAGRFLRTIEAVGEMTLDKDKEIDKQIVRSLELTAIKEAEKDINVNTEGKLYCVGYSVKNYYLNGYVISNLLNHKGDNMKVEVIATFLPRSVVDSLYAVMNKVSLRVNNLTLEPIAAIEAVIPKNLRLLNLALVDVGAGTSDIAICNKESITAYGMVPQAGDEITEAISQAYLVDFNTAEIIKRGVGGNEDITYTDVIGFENTISSKEVEKLVETIVDKISKEIATRIIDLNGGKSPSAVFLVGGGAHTPLLKDKIVEKLNIPAQRIAIKGRESVTDCVCTDYSLGSTGVTVLGIALVAIKSLGHDFIDVTLNGTEISLFNSHKHTIMDVLLQGGINPKILIGKNGKSSRFFINDLKRISFGDLGENAKIFINSKEGNLETEVNAGDNIEIEYAKSGEDAKPKIYEFLKDYDELSFYIDDELINLEPVAYINGEKVALDTLIKDGDKVQVSYSKSLGEIKEYILKGKYVNEEDELYIGENLLEDEYKVAFGDKITVKNKRKELKDHEQDIVLKDEIKVRDLKEDYENDSKGTNVEDTLLDEESRIPLKEIEQDTITVRINREQYKLYGKKSYVFVDIFNYYKFDLSVPKGNINLRLNGNIASYTDVLKHGDNIEVFWD